MGKACSRMRGPAKGRDVGLMGSSLLSDGVDQGCGWVSHGRQQEPGMMHGREYSKRILAVNPPMGQASGPPVCPIGAPASRQRPSSPLAAAPASRTATTPRQLCPMTHDLAFNLLVALLAGLISRSHRRM